MIDTHPSPPDDCQVPHYGPKTGEQIRAAIKQRFGVVVADIAEAFGVSRGSASDWFSANKRLSPERIRPCCLTLVDIAKRKHPRLPLSDEDVLWLEGQFNHLVYWQNWKRQGPRLEEARPEALDLWNRMRFPKARTQLNSRRLRQ